MVAPLTFRGRLPGVLIETALPARRENPLRLDIAGFVGFAERGPLNTPVALEDYSQYTQVFGEDLAVAQQDGAPVFAYLPSAVRAFFDNGGRRCYVVRVAGAGARPNQVPIPGLASFSERTFRQVMAPAAWVGRWSDEMTVGTQLRSLPLRLAQSQQAQDVPFRTTQINLELPTPTTVLVGDVLRLSFGDALATQRYAQVSGIEVGVHTVRGFPTTLTLELMTRRVFSPNVTPPADVPTRIERLGASGWENQTGARYPLIHKSGKDASFHLFLPETSPVQPGDLLRVRYADGVLLLFPVAIMRTYYAPASADAPPDGDPVLPQGVYRRAISDAPLWQREIDAASARLVEVERLRFDLRVTEGEQTVEIWQDLSFGAPPAAPDADRYDLAPSRPVTNFWQDRLTQIADNGRAVDLSGFAQRSLRLRAPTTTPDTAPVWLPLGMRPLPTYAAPLPDSTLPGKDGLDQFDAEALFLDPQLADAGVESLLARAEDILYLQQPTGALTRIHSLVGIEEVALIAVPDLAHRAWFPPPFPPPPPAPQPPPTPPEPDHSRFEICEPPPVVVEPPYDPEKANCHDALIPLLPGMLTVERDPCSRLSGLPELQPPDSYNPEPLLNVQRALVKLCAARADVLAVLSLPAHFKRYEMADWQQRFVNTPALLSSPALSYAAVYHGWTLTRETTCPALSPVRAIPPDGALCGEIAAREQARGAWIAPANQPLIGIIGLTPAFDDSDWEDLYNRQINVLRQQPGRFTLMSAFTLSADRLLVEISVRRLMIFLRKLALRRGQQFVFESNNERFRQQVQVSFERTLNALLDRGALTAFEVLTNSEINTPEDAFNGRFLVALKVAPTLPVEFITVVMLRSGENLLEILER